MNHLQLRQAETNMLLSNSKRFSPKINSWSDKKKKKKVTLSEGQSGKLSNCVFWSCNYDSQDPETSYFFIFEHNFHFVPGRVLHLFFKKKKNEVKIRSVWMQVSCECKLAVCVNCIDLLT